MKILHLGGYPCITGPLACIQRRAGHTVVVNGCQTREALLTLPDSVDDTALTFDQIVSSRFDLMQFHRSESLARLHTLHSDLKQALKHLKGQGTRLTYFSYGEDPLAHFPTPNLPREELHHLFDHFFLGTPENLPLVNGCSHWTWLGLGVDIQSINPISIPSEGPQGGIRILHVPFSVYTADTTAIREAVKTLQAQKLVFSYRELDPRECSSMLTVRSALSTAHVLIEQISLKSYGLLAIEALAHGLTVISGNSAEHRQQWSQLNISPVIDANGSNLVQKLGMVIREPKCLRDLTARSRRFAECHHDLESIGGTMIAVYERLCLE